MPETQGEWWPAIITPKSQWPESHLPEEAEKMGRPQEGVGKRIYVRETGHMCPAGENHRYLEVDPDSARAAVNGWGKFWRPTICECQILAD